MKRVACAFALVLSATTLFAAEDPLAAIRAVADGYPPKIETEAQHEQIVAAFQEQERALLARKSDYLTELTLGDLYRMGHNLDVDGAGPNAIKHLGNAAALDPTSPDPHLLLGRHYTFSNELTNGEVELLRAHVLGAEEQAVWQLTWNAYLQKQYALALEFANRGLNANPNDAAMKFLRDQSTEALHGTEKKTIRIEQ